MASQISGGIRGSSMTSWRLWPSFILPELGFPDVSTSWRLKKTIPEISAEYILGYHQHGKNILYTRKHKLKFFFLLVFSLHWLCPAFRQVNIVSLTVSYFCFGAFHGREIHQGLLKMQFSGKFVVSRRVFWGNTTMFALFSYFSVTTCPWTLLKTGSRARWTLDSLESKRLAADGGFFTIDEASERFSNRAEIWDMQLQFPPYSSHFSYV